MTEPATMIEPNQAEVFGGIVPYLVLSDASAAAAFYQQAFGARELCRYPPDDQGRYMHIHLHVNGGSLMLCDPFPDHGYPYQAPQDYSLHMRVADVDASWQRAVDAGAEVLQPLQKMFWGDRYGELRDPFGVLWSIAAPDA
jgi:uncharacterized glyoxalase superfamily protein PhnB